jgi:hypothetical protein
MPAGIVLLLTLIDRHLNHSESLHIVLGAMILSQSISAIVMLSQHMAHLKHSHALG